MATGRVVEAFDELKDGHPRRAVRSEAAPEEAAASITVSISNRAPLLAATLPDVTRANAPARLLCSFLLSRRRSRPLRLGRGDARMATSYEDSFGFREIACPEERTFFGYVKSQSVRAWVRLDRDSVSRSCPAVDAATLRRGRGCNTQLHVTVLARRRP
jgi:hypothetical protein